MYQLNKVKDVGKLLRYRSSHSVRPLRQPTCELHLAQYLQRGHSRWTEGNRATSQMPHTRSASQSGSRDADITGHLVRYKLGTSVPVCHGFVRIMRKLLICRPQQHLSAQLPATINKK